MNNHNYCVILAGGPGTRSWPLSREDRPKQFLCPTASGGKTFLRIAYERFSGLIPEENILVVTLEKYHDLVKESIPELPERNLLLEPYSRDTGPCIALATYSILKRDPEAVLVVSPSDQIINGIDLFHESVEIALEYAARNNVLITLGIVPDRANTNYGYIQAVGGAITGNWNQPRKIKTFTEKPDKELAEVFVNSGEFFWNSSIFVCRADRLCTEMAACAPQITGPFRGWENWIGEGESEKVFLQKVYMQCEKASFDIAILEKTNNAWILPARFKWSDIGTWESLYSYLTDRDPDGNIAHADKSIIRSSSGSFIYTTSSGKLVAIKGLENMLVVDSDDVLLICPRDEKDIKEIKANIAMPGYENFR